MRFICCWVFAGLCLKPRFWLPMLAYFVLRSAMLMTVEAPEARYTLECFRCCLRWGEWRRGGLFSGLRG